MIKFQGMEFDTIEDFDCHVLSFSNSKERVAMGSQSGYCTVLPISPLDFRKTHKTKAKVRILRMPSWTIFYIDDDLGRCHMVHISNDHKFEIEYATVMALEANLI